MTGRPLPQPDPETAFFWEGARQGQLLILRCGACGLYIHPPRSSCRRCGSAEIHPAPVSGRGAVHTFTVTRRALPGFDPPFAVVLVELEEQPGLRLVSNLLDVAPERIEIGLPVEVAFEPVADDVTLPLFRRRAR